MDPRDVQLQRQRKEPAPDGPAKGKAKKNTKRWCRGRVGREHQLAIIDGEKWSSPCGPVSDVPFWVLDKNEAVEPYWSCRHQMVCTACSKILEYFLPNYRCPLWPDPNAVRLTPTVARWLFGVDDGDWWWWVWLAKRAG